MDHPHTRRNALLRLAALGILPANAVAQTDGYPGRPITLLCGLGAGGMVDVFMRVTAQAAGKILRQPVVVENRPGAGGVLGAQQVARMQSGDGYTLIQSSVTVVRAPFMRPMEYDPIKDLTWIICLVSVPYVLAVRADSPYQSLRDLLADAKAKPQSVTYGSVGVGTGHHILGETMASRTGAQMIHVPYKGGAENMLALLGGQTSIAYESSAAFPFVDSGKVRLLATFGSKRLARYPTVPTAVELGHDVVYTSPLGIAGPKNMPAHVVKAIHDAFLGATQDPEYLATLKKFELVPDYKNTADYSAWARESAAYEKSWVEKLGLKEKV